MVRIIVETAQHFIQVKLRTKIGVDRLHGRLALRTARDVRLVGHHDKREASLFELLQAVSNTRQYFDLILSLGRHGKPIP